MKHLSLYLVPGFLTDKTIYKDFLLDDRLNCKVIEFLEPIDKEESIENYAKRMSELIDPTQKFVLLGTSFGGILSIEIAKHITPECIIFISSVKNRQEMNPLMKIDKSSLLLNYIPSKVVRKTIKTGYKFASKVKPLKEIHNEEIENMIGNIGGKLEKWIIQKINTWKGENQVEQFLHLHGNKDHVFPIKNIKDHEVIEGGNHNMIITQSEFIVNRVVEYLAKK